MRQRDGVRKATGEDLFSLFWNGGREKKREQLVVFYQDGDDKIGELESED